MDRRRDSPRVTSGRSRLGAGAIRARAAAQAATTRRSMGRNSGRTGAMVRHRRRVLQAPCRPHLNAQAGLSRRQKALRLVVVFVPSAPLPSRALIKGVMSLASVSIQGYRSVRHVTLPVEDCSIFVGRTASARPTSTSALGLLHRPPTVHHPEPSLWKAGSNPCLGRQASGGKPVPADPLGEFDTSAYTSRSGFSAASKSRSDNPSQRGRLDDVGAHRQGGAPLMTQGRTGSVVMMERKGQLVWLRDEIGRRGPRPRLLPSETALASFGRLGRYPELRSVRREVLDWRLYHDFRTDAESPIRQPCWQSHADFGGNGQRSRRSLATLFRRFAKRCP